MGFRFEENMQSYNLLSVTSTGGTTYTSSSQVYYLCYIRGRHVRDHMVVGLTTNCAINAYHH
jgi:hypothetical protein